MPILHMTTETVRATGQYINQTSESLRQQAQQLQTRTQQLASEWQSPSATIFEGEMQSLLQRIQQTAEIGTTLHERVQREVDEWERVASGLGGGSGSWLANASALPISGGSTNPWLSEQAFLTSIPLPAFFAVNSLASLIEQWPDWLKEKLARFLPFLQPPPPTLDSTTKTTTPLGELLNEPTPVSNDTETAVPPPPTPSPLGDGYTVPIKSQGKLGGSAACSPTSTSMILDYYHSLNAENKTATPEELLAMLDKGDFTFGKGMSLGKITDELNELGYQGSSQVKASMADLQEHLKEGPVIATVNLNTKTNQLSTDGNEIHAVVIKGFSADGQTVLINDPWVGKEVQLPLKDFEATWAKGSQGLYIIRPMPKPVVAESP